LEEIRIQNISKEFDGFLAVDSVDLTLKSGELFSFLGPSGCGKTTLLRMIAGFEIPLRAKIYIGDQSIATGLTTNGPSTPSFKTTPSFLI
jgi:ABC-type Fe3+/spermidine/putrescine transport system ATPase subunit